MERYLEDHIGFRPALVRLRNQLAFSLFKVPRSSGILIGRHNVLFETLQAKSYGGYQLLDEARVRSRAIRLRTVQQDLAKRGVQFLFVMAPNKARFQPEDLPAAMQIAPGTPSNYSRYIKALQANAVNLLDMVPLFAAWKKTEPYPLFSRAGTHWSGYGATLAADTLLRRLEQLGSLRFPTMRTVGPPVLVQTTDSLRGNDNDLATPLNLLQQTEPIPVAYRQLAFDPPRPGQTRPPALFVGDSFLWGLSQFSPYLTSCFADDTRLWYYGMAVYLPDKAFTPTGLGCQDVDLQQQIESRQFIVLMITEHNLIKSEFGFTDRVYRLYHPYTPAENVVIEQIANKLITAETTQQPDSAWAHQAQAGYMAKIRAEAEDIYILQHRN
ncbi:alginate O-acetyltransferase AlgX-related protein [Hymenobacter sp. BT770]|uniref:alginate O-acetyltransferase AlgX-related protein n=1 Tax=Hymenobacter sp. BT770 TaxID=2886942 RepID=UPI001D0F4E3B|nr:hypothetical protein [Hymenobacter sp. BT770]